MKTVASWPWWGSYLAKNVPIPVVNIDSIVNHCETMGVWFWVACDLFIESDFSDLTVDKAAFLFTPKSIHMFEQNVREILGSYMSDNNLSSFYITE